MNADTHVAARVDEHRVGTVFYDSSCRFCIESVRRFEHVLARHGFSLMPLQAPGTAARLGIAPDELLAEMRLQLDDGTVYGGAEGVTEIARHIWWGWPLWAVSRLPGAMFFLRSLYRWVARQRDCANSVCAVKTQARKGAVPFAFLPLLVMPVIVLVAAARLPRWGFMWAMAVALYAGCKWLTYCEAKARGVRANLTRALGYLLAWPGMDAATFLSSEKTLQPQLSEWPSAILKTSFGAMLLIVACSTSLPMPPLLKGWMGMIGVIFLLHFGSFHLLSLLWRTAGVDAKRVMHNPLRSSSLSEFWGRRWNTAFHELASRFTFKPLRGKYGTARATFAVFLVSGLLHELVISLPARGGYGLPTGYFLLQALGISVERTQFGRDLGMGKGWRGWVFTTVVVAGPAFWLFHPQFVRNVILPMLAAIGQLRKYL